MLCQWDGGKSVWALRPIHTRDFALGARSRGTLRKQSSFVYTNDFIGILHPREQNFHPTKCSTIFNRLNIWEQAPDANWANLKTLPRVYWHMQNEPGACSGSRTPRVYRDLDYGKSFVFVRESRARNRDFLPPWYTSFALLFTKI